jgi:hypothetical protein
VFGAVCIRTLKAHYKLKEYLNLFKLSEVTCLNQGLLMDIVSRHFYSGETVPLKEEPWRRKKANFVQSSRHPVY